MSPARSMDFGQLRFRQLAFGGFMVLVAKKYYDLYQTSFLPFTLYAILSMLLSTLNLSTSLMESLPEPPKALDIYGHWVLLDFVFFLSLWFMKLEWPRYGRLSFWHAGILFIVVGVLINRVVLILWFNPSPHTNNNFGIGDVTQSVADTFSGTGFQIQDLVSGRNPADVDIRKIIAGPEHDYFVIKHLRNAMGMLDNRGKAYCLDILNERDSVELPVKLKGRPPWELLVSRRDISDSNVNEVVQVRIHEHDISNKVSEAGIVAGKTTIRVHRFGVYKLDAIYDAQKVQGRVPGDYTAVVTACPQGFWKFGEAQPERERTVQHGHSRTPERRKPIVRHTCVGHKSEDIYIGAVGIPQLTVQYLRKQADGPSTTSQITLGEAKNGTRAFPNQYEQRMLFEEFPVEFPSPGRFTYEVMSVSDGLNSTLGYSKGKTEEGKSTVVPGDAFTFNVHPPPAARFSGEDVDGDGPLRIPISKTQDTPKDHWVVQLKGTPPFDIQYDFKAHDQNQTEKLQMIGIDMNVASIPIYNAGTFILTGVRDAYCDGRIFLPFTRKALPAFPPKLTIKEEPIEDVCLGRVGTTVMLVLEGTPPFGVRYRQVSGSSTHAQTHSVRTSKFQHPIELRPTEPGQHTYEFLEVSDFYFPSGVSVKDIRVSQTVHPESSAKFEKRDGIYACQQDGQTLAIPVILKGSAPWDLKARLTKNGSVEWENEFKGITDERFIIEISAPATPGRHLLELLQVKDKKGCSKDLENESIDVHVLEDPPTANFEQLDSCSGEECTSECEVRFLVGGEGRLSISSTGYAPFTFTVQEVNSLGEPVGGPIPLSSRSTSADFKSKKPGIYRLEKFRDRYCNGVISEPRLCSLVHIPKPRLEIDVEKSRKTIIKKTESILEREPICEDAIDHFGIKFFGEKPFKFTYEVIFSEEIVDRRSIAVPGSEATLRLKNSPPGVYIYRMSSVGDLSYDHSVPAEAADGKQLMLVQRVWPSPVASFRSPRTLYKCQNEPLDIFGPDGAIPLELEGQPPFHIAVEVQRLQLGDKGKTSVVKFESNERVHDLNLEEYLQDEGAYEISIASVRDGRGCDSGPRYYETAPESVNAKLRVEVTGTAKVGLDGEENMCVGSTVHFSLTGKAPFFVAYQLNEMTRRLEVMNNDVPYGLFLDQPGMLKILSVCHVRPGHCCSTPVERNQMQIQPQPRAYLGADESRMFLVSESEEVGVPIRFRGTPPFTVEFSRKYKQDGGHGPEVTETFIQSNIMDDVFVFRSFVEGTYTILSVSDKYCRWPDTTLLGKLQGTNARN